MKLVLFQRDILHPLMHIMSYWLLGILILILSYKSFSNTLHHFLFTQETTSVSKKKRKINNLGVLPGLGPGPKGPNKKQGTQKKKPKPKQNRGYWSKFNCMPVCQTKSIDSRSRRQLLTSISHMKHLRYKTFRIRRRLYIEKWSMPRLSYTWFSKANEGESIPKG